MGVDHKWVFEFNDRHQGFDHYKCSVCGADDKVSDYNDTCTIGQGECTGVDNSAVPVPDPTPPVADTEVLEQAPLRCVKTGCGKLVTMPLTHEDGDMVQYDGACTRCGSQYHLILDKDEA